MVRRSGMMSAVCGAALFAIACQAPAPRSWGERFLEARSEVGARSARELSGLVERGEAERAYRVEDGSERPPTESVRIVRVEDDETYGWRRHLPGGRIEHLGVDEEGSVVIGAVEDLEHQALTRYEPAVVLVPAGVGVGDSVTVEAEMTVLDRNNTEVVRNTGTCTQTVERGEDQRVVAPAGRFDCRRYVTRYAASLTLASVEQRSTEWYAPAVGLVARQSEEDVRALLFNRNRTRRMVLAERGGE